jgi:hypothetical protein
MAILSKNRTHFINLRRCRPRRTERRDLPSRSRDGPFGRVSENTQTCFCENKNNGNRNRLPNMHQRMRRNCRGGCNE